MLINIQKSNLKLGIIAGGQLGKMLIQEASKWDITTYVLDDDISSPASSISTFFQKGSRLDYKTVYQFGKKVDILTFEIESINIEALLKLQNEGILIVPDPKILQLFQNKEAQKAFYLANGLPAVRQHATVPLELPFVQKLKTGGYDGRGVFVVKNQQDMSQMLEGDSIYEDFVDIKKEIAVIVARNKKGQIQSFPAVELVFNKEANLVERLICPADITKEQHEKAKELSHFLIDKLEMSGLLAIEFFIDSNGNLIINEAAPRPHNSGHHTIESVMTSQYEQHIRAILNLPLGSTEIKMPSVMLNLLGEPGYIGNVLYEGLEDALAIDGVKIHLYGKKITKPFRKMGHITIIDKKINVALEKADRVNKLLRVKS